ncbi:MAG: hypothetical protein ACRDN8_09860 [Thermoleophilaceae bacterium]
MPGTTAISFAVRHTARRLDHRHDQRLLVHDARGLAHGPGREAELLQAAAHRALAYRRGSGRHSPRASTSSRITTSVSTSKACSSAGATARFRPWLVELLAQAYAADPNLEKPSAHIEDTGEVSWLVADALRMEVPTPVIAQAGDAVICVAG